MTENGAGTPPVDLREALDRAMGEKEFLAMLFEEFYDGLKAQIEQLRQAISHEDHAALSKQSHTLKGAAGNLSIKAMATVVKRLEAAGRGGDFQESLRLVDEMESEAVRLRNYLDHLDWSSVN